VGVIAALWSCYWTWQMWSNWATGIRVDQAGIRIGGVRGFERHGPRLSRRPRLVANQRHEVFTCPWAAVSALAVTDRADLEGLFERQPSGHARGPRPSRTAARIGYYQLRGWPRNVDNVAPRRPRTIGFRLGWLSAPFMRTGLVVVVVPDKVQFPQLRPVRGRYGRERFNGTPSTVWLAPTRHPQALRAALARAPGGPPVADHVGSDLAAWSG
jgi:hypothetical protein